MPVNSSYPYDGNMTGTPARVEIVTRTERRRRWSSGQKLEIVRQTLAPNTSVSDVARRYEIAPSQLFGWRKQALAGARDGFLPVEVTPSVGPAASISASPFSPPRGGLIELDLPNGYRVRVGSDVDGPALQRVLAAVAGVVAGVRA